MASGDELRGAASIEQMEFERLQEVSMHKIQLVTDKHTGGSTVNESWEEF